MRLNDLHYCKWCETNFKIKVHEKECGDFFLVCPTCKYKHYRRFENGVAVHCNLSERTTDSPIEIFGK
jgi:hypothetical protein